MTIRNSPPSSTPRRGSYFAARLATRNNNTSLSQAVRGLLHKVGLAHVWGDDGPRGRAHALRDSDGGTLDEQQRVLLLAAWAIWNDSGDLRVYELKALEPALLATLAELLLALDGDSGESILLKRWIMCHGVPAIVSHEDAAARVDEEFTPAYDTFRFVDWDDYQGGDPAFGDAFAVNVRGLTGRESIDELVNESLDTYREAKEDEALRESHPFPDQTQLSWAAEQFCESWGSALRRAQYIASCAADAEDCAKRAVEMVAKGEWAAAAEFGQRAIDTDPRERVWNAGVEVIENLGRLTEEALSAVKDEEARSLGRGDAGLALRYGTLRTHLEKLLNLGAGGGGPAVDHLGDVAAEAEALPTGVTWTQVARARASEAQPCCYLVEGQIHFFPYGADSTFALIWERFGVVAPSAARQALREIERAGVAHVREQWVALVAERPELHQFSKDSTRSVLAAMCGAGAPLCVLVIPTRAPRAEEVRHELMSLDYGERVHSAEAIRAAYFSDIYPNLSLFLAVVLGM